MDGDSVTQLFLKSKKKEEKLQIKHYIKSPRSLLTQFDFFKTETVGHVDALKLQGSILTPVSAKLCMISPNPCGFPLEADLFFLSRNILEGVYVCLSF